MGKLIVISGPSGVGKGTIIKRVLKRLDNVKLSVSCTTRAPRVGEEDGVHYHFISKEEFEKMIAEEGFLEYESFFDNYYGTPRQMVKDEIEKGNNIIQILLDINF